MYVCGLVIPVPETGMDAYRSWADKANFHAAEQRMHDDPRMDSAGDPPFDARRLILGCFQPIATMGRHN